MEKMWSGVPVAGPCSPHTGRIMAHFPEREMPNTEYLNADPGAMFPNAPRPVSLAVERHNLADE